MKVRLIIGWGALLAGACTTYYRPPASAPVALGSVDERATVLDIDGVPLRPLPSKPPREFLIGAGCRSLTVKYEESYFIWGGKKAIKKGLGDGLGPALAESEVHSYETQTPIRFFVPVRAGNRYWITATFTGEEFIPRVVELAPNGDTVQRFLPDQRCP